MIKAKIGEPRYQAHETDDARNLMLCVVGADGNMHYSNGAVEPLDSHMIVEGYDAQGLAWWIVNRLLKEYPILEGAVEDYGETIDDIEHTIMEALEDVGFK